MLNMTKVAHPDMFIFFEKGMRDRVSYISYRYSKANNKYLKSYDPKEESKHIYLKANSLHGYAIFEFLTTSRFKWVDHKEFNLNKYNSGSSKGCALEFDIEYSKELRKLHND